MDKERFPCYDPSKEDQIKFMNGGYMESFGRRLVTIFMVDSKFAQLWPFEILIDDPLPQIRYQYAQFLRRWLLLDYTSMKPIINLYFDAPEDDMEYVKDGWCGECRHGKNLVLNRENLQQPEKIIIEVLNAFDRAERRWTCHFIPELKLVKK